MKQKIVAAGVILCLTIIGSIYFATPSQIVNNPDKVQIQRVIVVNSKYEDEDITSQIDCKKLAQTISSYNRSKISHRFAPYQMAIGDIELDYTDNNKVRHVLLGSVNVVYESADKGGYNIYNSDQLIINVKKMIKVTEETIYKMVNDLDGVTLKTLKTAYSNNVDEIEFIFENNTDKEYIFGSQYQLEKLEDGKWYQLLPNEQEIFWTLEGHPLKPNSIRKETLNIGWIYGNYFVEGTYRIVKRIHVPRSPDDMFYLAAEFNITD